MFTPDYTKTYIENYQAWFTHMEGQLGHGDKVTIDDNKALELCAQAMLHPWKIHDHVFGKDALSTTKDFVALDGQLSYHLKRLLTDVQRRANWNFELTTRFCCSRSKKIIEILVSLTDPDMEQEKKTQYGFIGLDMESMSILEEIDAWYTLIGKDDYITYLVNKGVKFSDDTLYYWKPFVLLSIMEEYKQWTGTGSLGTAEQHYAEYAHHRFHKRDRLFTATPIDSKDETMGSPTQFSLVTLPKWLNNRSTGTMDMSWFVDGTISTLSVGETVKTDFNIIERIK